MEQQSNQQQSQQQPSSGALDNDDFQQHLLELLASPRGQNANMNALFSSSHNHSGELNHANSLGLPPLLSNGSLGSPDFSRHLNAAGLMTTSNPLSAQLLPLPPPPALQLPQPHAWQPYSSAGAWGAVNQFQGDVWSTALSHQSPTIVLPPAPPLNINGGGGGNGGGFRFEQLLADPHAAQEQPPQMQSMAAGASLLAAARPQPQQPTPPPAAAAAAAGCYAVPPTQQQLAPLTPQYQYQQQQLQLQQQLLPASLVLPHIAMPQLQLQPQQFLPAAHLVLPQVFQQPQPKQHQHQQHQQKQQKQQKQQQHRDVKPHLPPGVWLVAPTAQQHIPPVTASPTAAAAAAANNAAASMHPPLPVVQTRPRQKRQQQQQQQQATGKQHKVARTSNAASSSAAAAAAAGAAAGHGGRAAATAGSAADAKPVAAGVSPRTPTTPAGSAAAAPGVAALPGASAAPAGKGSEALGLGSLVWAKVDRFPWWPAVVVRPTPDDYNDEGAPAAAGPAAAAATAAPVFVRFLGTHDTAWCKVSPWLVQLGERSSKTKAAAFLQGLREGKEYAATGALPEVFSDALPEAVALGRQHQLPAAAQQQQRGPRVRASVDTAPDAVKAAAAGHDGGSKPHAAPRSRQAAASPAQGGARGVHTRGGADKAAAEGAAQRQTRSGKRKLEGWGLRAVGC